MTLAMIKVSAVVLAGLVAVALLRRQSAALRHLVLACALVFAAAIPILGLVVPAWQVPVELGRAGLTATPQDVGVLTSTTDPVASVPPIDARATAPRRAVLPSPVLLWLIGSAVSFLGLLAGFGRLVWIASRASEVKTGPLCDMARAGPRSVDGPARGPDTRLPVKLLLQADHPALLVTWGFRRPKVMLPNAVRQWPSDRIHVVLRHELAHVQRRDWLVQMVAECVRCVYWFNPLVWIACARLRQYGEQACDDAVLNVGVRPSEYAAHLLEVARDFRRVLLFPAPAMARPSQLERRVRAMLNGGTNRAPLTVTTCSAAVVMLLALTIPLAGLGGSSRADARPVAARTHVAASAGSTPAPGAPAASPIAAPVRPASTHADGHAQAASDLPKLYTGPPVSVDFKGADIRAVLRVFSEVAGLSLVIDPRVQGKVDASLRDVPWDQALDAILKTAGLTRVIEGNIVRIVPGDAASTGLSSKAQATAQAAAASLAGVIRDATGRTIPGVLVTVVGQGLQPRLRTGEDGTFALGGLPAGEYQVEAQKPGFMKFAERVAVAAGQPAQREIVLQIGALAETVVVSGLKGAAAAVGHAVARPIAASAAVSDPCAGSAVGGCITPPAKLVDARPIYPSQHAANGVSGSVTIEGHVGTDGFLNDLKANEGADSDFAMAAMEAVSLWQYAPVRLNGIPQECRITVTVKFTADPEREQLIDFFEAEVKDAQTTLASLQMKYTEHHPEVVRTQRMIELLEARLAALKGLKQ